MEGQIFKDINTDLDLNGPYLSFTTQPSDQTTSSPGSVSYTGLATVSYGASVSSPDNIGTLEYQWYEVGVGALTNGGNISGATTGTLTLSNIASGTDDNREFYLAASYLPAKADYQTGNPPNEPLNSDTVGMTITPNIEVISQPTAQSNDLNVETTFSVNADLTDGTTTGLQYQWYLDGVAETNRTKKETVTTSTTVASPQSYSWSSDANHTLPTTATNIKTTIKAAGGGHGGSDAGGSGGNQGRGRGGEFTLEPTLAGSTLKYRIGSVGGGVGGCSGCYGPAGVVSGGGGGGPSPVGVTFNIRDNAGASNWITIGGVEYNGQSNYSTPATLQTNLDYTVTARSSCGGAWLRVGPPSQINLDDCKPGGDGDYNDMQVTASTGTFTNANRSTATFRIEGGTTGSDGSGSRGGRSGYRGWSGGGGGGGSASFIEGPTGFLVVAGGGGGGGGGSHNRHSPGSGGPGGPTDPAMITADGKAWVAYPGPVPLSSGSLAGNTDHQGGSDGGGGGGGGGGSPGNEGGRRGNDNSDGGTNGNGGGSRYDDPKANLVSSFVGPGNGYASLSYDSTTETITTTQRNTVISGVNTPTLTLKSDWTGTQTVKCVITHASAGNSPVTTDEVTYSVIPGTGNNNMVKVENIGITNTALNIVDVNLNNGEYEFPTTAGISDDAGQQNVFSFYSPNKDIKVQMDLYGGKGLDDGGNAGGEGGYGRIQFTMKQNQEYVLAGLSTFINAPYLYEGGNLMACVGGGGHAGSGSNGGGGKGGGINIDGEKGKGSGSGLGGALGTGTLQSNGIFGSNYIAGAKYAGDIQAIGAQGGKTIICTKGVYWRQQGKGACDSLGTTKFRTSNGTEVTNTASITRGYKAGYNIIQTAGKGLGIGAVKGNGGNGLVGGNGAISELGGGGGGSGYASGNVTIVDSQLGGSTTNARVVLRVVT